MRLRGFVARSEASRPLLPLTHSASSIVFRQITEDGRLLPTQDSHFGEPLLYLFYGRPAYRVEGRRGSRTDFTCCPVCFVLKPESIKAPRRIFPFDSGAFVNQRFGSYIHEHISIGAFDLGVDMDTPARVVGAFFSSNRRYFVGEVTRPSGIAFSDMEVQAYVDLISATGESDLDDRRYTIEVQTTDVVSLSGSLMAVVLPLAALDDREILDAVTTRWQAVPLTYDTFQGGSPTEYYGAVRQRISDFLTLRGYI